MQIRIAEEGDLEGILKVEQGCGEAPQWGETVWRQVLREAAIGEGLRSVMVAESGERVVGFVATGGVADVAEMESVAVGVGHRGQGVGKELCRAAMRWVAARGAKSMELEVRASSAAARRMYAGLGFVEQGIRSGYYRDPAEDAVLMRAELSRGE